jgi:uncharacterized protein (DUF983 family)
MKCPHCGGSIGLFSRELNRFGKVKTCPQCGRSIRLFVSFKAAAFLFVPSVVLALLLRPVFVSFGLSGSLAVSLTTGLLLVLAMRLKAA